MVSGEICISGLSEYSRFSQAEICFGDQRCFSPNSTSTRNRGTSANLLGFGRRRRWTAASSASAARYRSRPPFRRTSLETDEDAGPRRRASARQDSPTAKPRDNSSRSRTVSSRRARCGVLGGTPPVDVTWSRTARRLTLSSPRPDLRPLGRRQHRTSAHPAPPELEDPSGPHLIEVVH